MVLIRQKNSSVLLKFKNLIYIFTLLNDFEQKKINYEIVNRVENYNFCIDC